MLEALLSWQFACLPPRLGAAAPKKTAFQRLTGHGDALRWNEALSELPDLNLIAATFEDCVSLDLEGPSQAALRTALMQLHPWRKGPFRLGDVYIDAEWNSSLKWNRLAAVQAGLPSAKVLDVGCGNGYYGWRMLGCGADHVVGVDHNPLWVAQHLAIQRYLKNPRNLVFPLGLSELPEEWRDFHVVFSMGVLSHSRDPLSHLDMLYPRLGEGGLLVLESLVVGTGSGELRPAGRYARMRNIWRLPGARRLQSWLQEAGFIEPQLLCIGPTTPDEQRRSEWMRFESLAESLDLRDSDRTIEGYPAPCRALFTARRP